MKKMLVSLFTLVALAIGTQASFAACPCHVSHPCLAPVIAPCAPACPCQAAPCPACPISSCDPCCDSCNNCCDNCCDSCCDSCCGCRKKCSWWKFWENKNCCCKCKKSCDCCD